MAGESPLKTFEDPSHFKLFMMDTGMLSTSFGVPPQSIINASVQSENFRGALAENFVMQQIHASNTQLWYWGKSGRAEVDFVMEDEQGNVVPIEVKSSDNARSRSLSIFMEKYPVPYAVRVSMKNFGLHNGIKNVPLYAAHCIKGNPVLF